MKYSILMLTVCLLFSCRKKDDISQQLQKQSGSALGTTYSILYFSPSKLAGVEKSLDSIFKVVNTSMSTYLPNSDISRINKGDTTVVVDNMFREVLTLSKEINTVTGGYFDPTVGKLVNAWGFGPKKLKLKMTDKVVDSLKQYTGLHKIILTQSGKIQKQNPNISLDFNAIAKGYCVDRIATYFDNKNIDDYLIELGGELVAKGKHLEKNTSWTVGIDDPNQKETRTLISSLSLNNKGMATSGNYRKFRIDSLTGKKYVHTINPLTGYTKASNVLSVSVLAENCATADAFATAFMAMPIEETKKIVSSRPDIDIYMLFVSSKDSLSTYISKGFERVLN